MQTVSLRLILAATLDATVAGAVQPAFNLTDPAIGPFPSDQFTVPDTTQITGRRVALPKPDCAKFVSDCQDISIVNNYDGFGLQPRIAISFDGPINPATVTSKTLSLVQFGGSAPPRLIGINKVVWDPPTKTLYLTSDEALDQSSRFALIATNGILDSDGQPVQPAPAFTAFLATGSGDYGTLLRAGLDAAVAAGIPRDRVVTASVFTTLSATAILEKIRDQIHAATPQPASFLANGKRTVFQASTIDTIVRHLQTRVTPPTFGDAAVYVPNLDFAPGVVGTVAFGTFASPHYLTTQAIMPPVGTLTGNPAVQATITQAFTLLLPSGTRPAKGWPVAIYGHGNGGLKEDAFNFASLMAKRGFATIAVNGPGHGYGPLGTIDIKTKAGDTVTLPYGGRGIDVDGNNTIAANEGFNAITAPYASVSGRDGHQQNTADLIQLVRVIQVGMDVDGDGQPDLDPARLYYLGNSMGGNIAYLLHAVEPAIRASAPSFAGGPRDEGWRLGAFRATQGAMLQQRVPSLINAPGMTRIGGFVTAAPFFNENQPLRNLPPLVNDVDGAIDIQRVFAIQSWIMEAGNSVAYAPFIRKRSLAGVPARPLLNVIALGDQTVPMPAASSIIRAGDLAGVTTLLRFDVVYNKVTNFPSRNPHGINTGLHPANIPLVIEVATAMQEQVGAFFEADGARISQPQPAEFFEVPIKLPLPESLDFLTARAPAVAPVDSAAYSPNLSPGGLFSILGPIDTLTPELNAGGGPSPTNLAGIMVTINGRPAPLRYVGANQINGQVPYETAAGPAVARIITYGTATAQLPFAVTAVAPRLFTRDGQQCIVQNDDGTLNAAATPARAGRYLGAYLTGLGAVTPNIETGLPAPAVPVALSSGAVTASLAGRRLTPTFAGLVTGLVGVGQVDLQVPADLPAGNQPFTVTVAGVVSNSCQVTVAR